MRSLAIGLKRLLIAGCSTIVLGRSNRYSSLRGLKRFPFSMITLRKTEPWIESSRRFRGEFDLYSVEGEGTEAGRGAISGEFKRGGTMLLKFELKEAVLVKGIK